LLLTQKNRLPFASAANASRPHGSPERLGVKPEAAGMFAD
jgi:hypothetical protein